MGLNHNSRDVLPLCDDIETSVIRTLWSFTTDQRKVVNVYSEQNVSVTLISRNRLF